jgi:cell division protein FtsZ
MQRRKRTQPPADIRVVGIGGGGVTAVNGLIRHKIKGVGFLTIDSDIASVGKSRAPLHVRIGRESSDGNGLLGNATRGEEAALNAAGPVQNALHGSDMVFIIAGLGGGTGTGAAPIIARAAKVAGALVIGIVTYPFYFEGVSRTSKARDGLAALRESTDTLILIPNDRLLKKAEGTIGFHETYRLAHHIWHQSIQGISEMLSHSGLINVDFADVRTIISAGSAAVIATGRGVGPNRARSAAELATRSDLLGVTIDGAHGVLFNVSGGLDMSLWQVDEAAEIITERVHPEANVIFGATVNAALENELCITVIATGFSLASSDTGPLGEMAELVWRPEPSLPRRIAERTL